MTSVLYLSEERVRQLFRWEPAYDAIEESLKAAADGRAVQKPRTFTEVPGKGVLLSMPGYLKSTMYGSLACKLVTSFPANNKRDPPLPTILANICLIDDDTGLLKCILSGTQITECRTALASVVATKHLHLRNSLRKTKILAVLGAGAQGRIHAIAFQHFLSFEEVRIWNRTTSRAEQLVSELQKKYNGIIRVYQSVEDCVKNADVIVTATFASSPILKRQWVKSDVHINAVGAGQNHHSELDEALYRDCLIYTDHWDGALVELKGLKDIGVKLKGTVGAVILGKETKPPSDRITVFHSLGMAVEDAAMARLIYDLHIKDSKQ